MKYHCGTFDRLPAHLRLTQIAPQELHPAVEIRKVGFVARAQVVDDKDTAPEDSQPGRDVAPDKTSASCDDTAHSACEHRIPLGSERGDRTRPTPWIRAFATPVPRLDAMIVPQTTT